MIRKFRYIKSKKEADRILYKIYRHIDSDCCLTVRFMKNLGKNVCGRLLWVGDGVVLLNPYHTTVNTFLHEYLHRFYEHKFDDENKILRMEAELMQWLSNRQLENLMIKMCRLIRVKPYSLSELKEELKKCS